MVSGPYTLLTPFSFPYRCCPTNTYKRNALKTRAGEIKGTASPLSLTACSTILQARSLSAGATSRGHHPKRPRRMHPASPRCATLRSGWPLARSLAWWASWAAASPHYLRPSWGTCTELADPCARRYVHRENWVRLRMRVITWLGSA